MKDNKNNILKLLSFGMSLKRWLLIVGYTIGVIFAVVFLNFSFRFINEKFDAKLDLSRNRNFSLSAEAKNYLKNCDRKLKFVVVEPAYIYGDVLNSVESCLKNEMLTAVAASNSNFELEYCRRLDKKEFSDKFKNVKFLNGKSRDFDSAVNGSYVGGGGDEKLNCFVIDETDSKNLKGMYLNLESFICGCENYNDFIKKIKNETKSLSSNFLKTAVGFERGIISIVEQLSGKNFINVVVTTGHKEIDFSLNSKFFDGMGLKFSKVDLKSADIAPECDVLFIAAPMMDFSKEEISKIEDYTNKGGKVFYCTSSMQSEGTSVLDEFLRKLGFVFSDGCVVDPNNFAKLGTVVSVDLKGQKNVITDKMVERDYPLVLGYCKPMNLQKAQDGWQVSEICKTTPKYVSIKNESDNLANAVKSEFVIAGMAQKSVADGKIAKFYVMSSGFFANGLFTQEKNRRGNYDDSGASLDGICLSNSNFIARVFKELSGKEGLPYIAPKFFEMSKGIDFEYTSLNEQKEKKNKMKIFMILKMLVVPAILILCAMLVWGLRKFLKK